MSKEINEIFEKFKNEFSGRQEEIKKYLLKHYKNNFVDNEVLKVEQRDESAKIKTSGFHKNLSSWRNTYRNIVISSCEEVKGKQKRFDYKFYFTEERLNAETIEQIESMIKESNRLKKLFNFPESLSTIDSAIELIRKKRDSFYNRRLNKTRSEILEVEEEYNDNIGKLEQLEEDYRNNQNSKDLENILRICEEIIDIAQIVRKRNIVNKYKKILDKIKNEIEEKKALEKKIAQLEVKIKRFRKQFNFEEALISCDQIIEFSIELENQEIEKKYLEIKTLIEKEREELGSIENQITQLEIDIKKYRDAKIFTEALSACDKIIELLKQVENEEKKQKYIEIKDTIGKNIAKIEEQIEELEIDIKKFRDENQFVEAISACDNIIEIAKSVENKGIEQKYAEIKALLEKDQQELGNIEEQIAQLEKDIDQNRKEKKFGQALSSCEKVIEFTRKTGDKNKEENYVKILEQIHEELEKQTLKEKEKALKEEKSKKIREGFEEKIALKLQEQNTLKEFAKNAEKIINVEDDVMPLVETFSVDDVLGDISGEINENLEALNNLLNDNRVEISNEVNNRTLITTTSGEVSEVENTIEIQEVKDKDILTKFTVQSGLENTFDDEIEEVILSDLIPYNFEITNIELNGAPPGKLPDKIMVEDGIELNWKLQNIQPKEKIEINYDLRRRVSRTVIFVLNNEVKMVKTHNNLTKSEEFEGFHEAILPITNSYEQRINGVVIEDIIPLYYVHIVKEPKSLIPTIISSKQGKLVKWNVGVMDPGRMIYYYRLMELYKLEELKININNLATEALEAYMNYQIPLSIEKYEKIVNTLKIYMK